MNYDKLLLEAQNDNLEIYEYAMTPNLKGLYSDNIIFINNQLTQTEKLCTLVEEIGHHHTSNGNILNQTDICNRKQELVARSWGYEHLIPLLSLVQAYQAGVHNRYELAKFLNVTEKYVNEAIKKYYERYGPYVKVENYILYFNPLRVVTL